MTKGIHMTVKMIIEVDKYKYIMGDMHDVISAEDKERFITAVDNDDIETQIVISKKYGFTAIPDANYGITKDYINKITSLKINEAEKKLELIELLFNNMEEGIINTQTQDVQNKATSISDLINLEMYHKEKNSKKHISNSIDILDDAISLLKFAGCNYTAKNLAILLAREYKRILTHELNQKMNEKRIIHQDRSKAGKGNTNKHKESALKIAKETWDLYPNASQEGMADELYRYFRDKRRDNPTSGAIKTWLSESGLNPKGVKKNRDFTLVINT